MPEQNNLSEKDADKQQLYSKFVSCRNIGISAHSQLAAGLAVASLAMGLMSLGMFHLAFIGAFAGAIGVILSAIHLSKLLPFRVLVIWGLTLSLVGLGLNLLYQVRLFYYHKPQPDEAFSKYYGKEVPDFTIKTIDGGQIETSNLKGKRVILDFWATWCPPCKKSIPHFIELRKKIPPEKLMIIGISDEPADTIRSFAEKMKINYPLAGIQQQSQLPRMFNQVEFYPTAFFIDANGVLESAYTGYLPLRTLKKLALGPAVSSIEEH